jgi:ABC-2 type transport system ATP-binding protein
MNIIKVKNLVKKYKKADFNSVDNISFEVKKGSFFAFLGANGAGKTTTISILTTTLSKTSGEISISGHDIDKKSNQIRRDIGIIAQNPSLDKNLTGEENIRIHAGLYGAYPFMPLYSMMSKEYQAKVENLSQVIELEDFLHKKVKTYSGGMKRKLEIIRSLIHEPKILFLDEPTTGLDPASRKSIWKYLNNLRQTSDLTIFLTTHYLEEAENADMVAIISHGKIVLQGTPTEIKNQLLDDYLIIDAADQKTLIHELKTKKIPFKHDPKTKALTLDLCPECSVQDYMKQIDTPLSRVDIYRPSLEEAYLKLLSN